MSILILIIKGYSQSAHNLINLQYLIDIQNLKGWVVCFNLKTNYHFPPEDLHSKCFSDVISKYRFSGSL